MVEANDLRSVASFLHAPGSGCGNCLLGPLTQLDVTQSTDASGSTLSDQLRQSEFQRELLQQRVKEMDDRVKADIAAAGTDCNSMAACNLKWSLTVMSLQLKRPQQLGVPSTSSRYSTLLIPIKL